MISDPAAKLLWDARRAADRIAGVVAGKSFADYLADDVMRWAVDRQFTILGEAFAALRRIEPSLSSSIPDLARIIAFRNVLIHGYAGVDDRLVWGVIECDLDILRSSLSRLLDPGGRPGDIETCNVRRALRISLGDIAMKLRSVGRSGLRVSQVGLGCNNLGQRIDFAASQAVVHKALDAGITLFDTADTYREKTPAAVGSEEHLGQILGARRKDIVLATKFGNPMDAAGILRGASRRYIMSAVEASLRRLRTDWIDLLQVHRPDPLTPIEETLRALDDLIRDGKVRYIGCSNFAAWQVVEALWTSRQCGLAPFVSCQDEYSLLMRRPEQTQIPMMQAYGIGLLPYYPLASGLLTGKYRRNAPLPADARLVVHVGR